MLSLSRSFAAFRGRALYTGAKVSSTGIASIHNNFSQNVSPTAIDAQLQFSISKRICSPLRANKVPTFTTTHPRKYSSSTTTSSETGIAELPEGEYRDYGSLPKSLLAKTDLYIPLGLLNRARTLALEHTTQKRLLESDYDSSLAIKVGKLAPAAKALRDYDDGFYNLMQIRDMLKWSDPTLSKDDLLTELDECKSALQGLATTLAESLIPPHQFAHLPCIVEIRPGTGGSEACLFVKDLWGMYSAYCAAKGYGVSVISMDTTTDMVGGGEGVNEVIFSIDFQGAYEIFTGESGVHRVQRIPLTETKGRVHTSTATVMVLPMFPEGEGVGPESIQIDPKDVRTEVMRSRGAGGQHVNTTDSAVRLTHIPTGIVAAIQDTRSQHKNREKAWTVLRARVAEKFRAEREAEEMALRRKALAGSAGVGGAGVQVEVSGSGGSRSDKIRTFNWKEGRVTDHRCGLTVYDLEDVVRGEVGSVERVLEAVRRWQMDQEMSRIAAEVGASS